MARHEGRVVFVRHALPGERVRARFTEAGDDARFWRADAVEILDPSPDRVDPPCPLAHPDGCGGCDWQHASLPAQRALKAAVVAEQLARLARTEWTVDVEPVPGDDAGLGWRTRVRFAVDDAGRTGLRKHRSHEIVPVATCPIAHDDVNAVDAAGHRWRAGAVEVVAGAAGTGEARALVVLDPVEGGRVAVPKGLPEGVSVAVAGGPALDRRRGRTWVGERVLIDGVPRDFRVTGTGFWQVHPGAAQTLLDAVLDAARVRPGDAVLDLYAGAGLFAAGLAAATGTSGSVLAVEADARAVADGRRSLHDLGTVRFEAGPVHRVLRSVERADVVVLDPPRSGAGAGVISAVAGLRPRRVVYVACDPAALARDVATAAGLGYRLAALRAFDVFPMTHHVECVATLVEENGPGEELS